jgi:glucose/arabinose dehydrogenase
MTFYTGKMFPAQYQGGIFVASHGSWNRTKASGALHQLRLAEGRRQRPTRATVFAEGWLDATPASTAAARSTWR